MYSRTRRASQPKGVETDASVRPPYLSSASCDLDLRLPGLKVDRFVPLSRRPLVPTGIKTSSLVFKISLNLVQTNERTDGRTDGQPENIMPPPASMLGAGTRHSAIANRSRSASDNSPSGRIRHCSHMTSDCCSWLCTLLCCISEIQWNRLVFLKWPSNPIKCHSSLKVTGDSTIL